MLRDVAVVADVCSAVAAASCSDADKSPDAEAETWELPSRSPSTRFCELCCHAARAPDSWPNSSWRLLGWMETVFPAASFVATLASLTTGRKIRTNMKYARIVSRITVPMPATDATRFVVAWRELFSAVFSWILALMKSSMEPRAERHLLNAPSTSDSITLSGTGPLAMNLRAKVIRSRNAASSVVLAAWTSLGRLSFAINAISVSMNRRSASAWVKYAADPDESALSPALFNWVRCVPSSSADWLVRTVSYRQVM